MIVHRTQKKVHPIKVCVVCGEEYQPIYATSKCCSHKCSATNYARQKAGYKNIKRGVPKLETATRSSSYRSPISDEEQLAINKAVDNRLLPKPEPCRTYKPGDPEFDRIAAELTPMGKISNVATGYGIPTLAVLYEVNTSQLSA